MSKIVRIVPLKDTTALQGTLEIEIKRRYPSGKIDQQSTSLWYLELPNSYDWTMEDNNFMNDLADNQNMLAGWIYQDRNK